MNNEELQKAFAEQQAALHEWFEATKAQGHALIDIYKALIAKAGDAERELANAPNDAATDTEAQSNASDAGATDPNDAAQAQTDTDGSTDNALGAEKSEDEQKEQSAA